MSSAGYGFVAIAYGLAFFLSILLFDPISAHMVGSSASFLVLCLAPAAMPHLSCCFSCCAMLIDSLFVLQNPAMLVALWVLGRIKFRDGLALAAAELLGATVGATVVWILYLPHFKTLPEPPASEVGSCHHVHLAEAGCAV